MRPIIITGARAPVALDLARAFVAAGHRVQLADCITPLMVRWSKACQDFIRLPSPNAAPDAFADAVTALACTPDAPLIIPTCEEVFHLARVAEERGWADALFAPSPAVLARLHSKAGFIAHAASLGLAVPETRRVTDPADMTPPPDWSNGVVLKPDYSRFGTEAMIRPHARQWASVCPTPARPWVMQRFVPGEEICLWAAALEGRIVATAIYRPAWRHAQAASFAFEPVDSSAARTVAEAIVGADKITGQVSFDIILTPDGLAIPIECNPRATSGVHLFGGDPALARALTGTGPAAMPPERFCYLGPAMATLGLTSAMKSGTLSRFVSDWRRGQDAVTRPGDRLPALGVLADSARWALAGLSGGRGARAAMTADIEWNGPA